MATYEEEQRREFAREVCAGCPDLVEADRRIKELEREIAALRETQEQHGQTLYCEIAGCIHDAVIVEEE